MASPKDYYKILGISKSATTDDVKKAFRKLAHEYHPDKASTDAKRRAANEVKFKEINEAYQVLSDAEKRKQYDQYGTTFEDATRSGAGFGGFSGFGGQAGFNVGFEDLEDLFGGVFRGFGGTRRTRRGTNGRDVQVTLTLDFREAVFGVARTIPLYKTVRCEHCAGSGADPQGRVVTCATCQGRGEVETTHRTILGVLKTVQTCGSCGGQGSRPEKLCGTCAGSGVVKETVTVSVRVPAGTADGDVLELPGQGEAGRSGGGPGNLYVAVRVNADPRFERRDDDVWTPLPLTFAEAALGAKRDVETLDGPVVLTVPEGTQTGKVFRLAGRGVPHRGGRGRGDHLVEVTVVTPTKLSRRQREALREFLDR